jgi:hypothetical protein
MMVQGKKREAQIQHFSDARAWHIPSEPSQIRALPDHQRSRARGLATAPPERGELLGSDEVFEELWQLIAQRKRVKKKATCE